MALQINKDTKMIFFLSKGMTSTEDNFIRSRMFADRNDLVEIVIPEGITRIEEDAFIGCSNLERVILPESVTDIECWGDKKHSWSDLLLNKPFSDLPQYLKEGRGVNLYPDHWR